MEAKVPAISKRIAVTTIPIVSDLLDESGDDSDCGSDTTFEFVKSEALIFM